jgi:hypothetical protein
MIFRLPTNLVKFVCHSSEIKGFSFDAFPAGLKHFDVYDNCLQSVPILPNVMLYVDISKNRLVSVSNIPDEVKNYDSGNNPELKFTPENEKVIEELQKNKENSVILNTDDNHCVVNFPESDTNANMSRYIDSDLFANTTRGNHRQTQSRVSLDSVSTMLGDTPLTDTLPSDTPLTDTLPSDTPLTDTLPSDTPLTDTLPSVNPRPIDNTMNSFFDCRRPGQSSHVQWQNEQRKSDRDRLNEYFSSMASNTRTMIRVSQRPQYPPHIMKLLTPDNFSPTKDPDRRIKHNNIYTV